MEFKYKKNNPDVLVRKQEALKILEKYPDRIPIICEKDPNCNLNEINKTKYLVPNDLTLSQFTFVVRNRLHLDKNSSLFLLVNGKHAISGDCTLSEIHERYGDKYDGFLYISYSTEIIWG